MLLQNDHKELWALLAWAVPDDMSSCQEFEKFYTLPIKLGQQRDANDLFLGKVGLLVTMPL